MNGQARSSERVTTGLPQIASADTGYWSELNAAYCDANGVDAYIATGRKDPDDPRLGRLPMTRAREARWQMHQKVTSAAGRAIYARRTKAAAEWGIVCLCHNLLKLHRGIASAAAS